MKYLLVVLALLALSMTYEINHDCPHDLEVRCIDDINKAEPVCEKAAREKGADVPMDLDCFKYFAKMEQDCWPCICFIAEQQHWHVKGCN